jgi:phage tail tape-measure protein
MKEQTTTRRTVTEPAVEPHEVVEKDYQTGVSLGGAVAGAVVGAVVAGPVGAVLGGAVGAVVGGAVGPASGATAGELDSKAKDDTTVVTREVRRS